MLSLLRSRHGAVGIAKRLDSSLMFSSIALWAFDEDKEYP